MLASAPSRRLRHFYLSNYFCHNIFCLHDSAGSALFRRPMFFRYRPRLLAHPDAQPPAAPVPIRRLLPDWLRWLSKTGRHSACHITSDSIAKAGTALPWKCVTGSPKFNRRNSRPHRLGLVSLSKTRCFFKTTHIRKKQARTAVVLLRRL